MTLPAGYAWVEATGGIRVFAWVGAHDAIGRALREHGTLAAWAAATPGLERLSGRGLVLSIPAPAAGPDGRARWAVRHYLRGGAVAARLGDRYLAIGPSRPLVELRAAVAARARRIPTPAVVAGSVHRGGAFYRADLVTELVPDAVDLADVLFDRARAAGDEDRSAALRAAGALLGRAARAGIVHADLNAKNVLVRGAASNPEAYMIDLDRCRVLAEGRAADADAMLRRLERSLTKLGERHGRPLAEDERHALRGAVGGRVSS